MTKKDHVLAAIAMVLTAISAISIGVVCLFCTGVSLMDWPIWGYTPVAAALASLVINCYLNAKYR